MHTKNFSLLLLVGLILLNPSLDGCSAITNTIAGLTTPQSTISGSNYVFWVDNQALSDGTSAKGLVLEQKYDQGNASLIRAGDNFKVSLDFGFLRYLQAVDPYVIVYSEAWMGPDPKPLDTQAIHRQVILLKDGLTPNAMLPLSSQSLLGPVTLEEGSNDVNLTLKIVVLSKSDNQQTINLLNEVAGFASTAAPAYAPVAGAAASIGAAIVSQNRDKIEFEHTFTFSPIDATNGLNSQSNKTILQEGKFIVFKGESEHRVVPYEHWGFYAWPFNWAGKRPDHASRRFEEKATEVEFNNFNVPWLAAQLPFYLVKSLFVPSEWFLTAQGTFPTALELNGQNIFCKKKELPPNTTDNSWFTHWSFGVTNKTCPRAYPYAEKTFMVFAIERTLSSHGLFNELVTKFSKQGAKINELSTASSDATKQSDNEVKEALDNASSEVLFARAKRKIQTSARRNEFNASDDFTSLNLGDQKRRSLFKLSVDERVEFTTRLYVTMATKMFQDSKAKNDSTKLKSLFTELITAITKTPWTDVPSQQEDKAIWVKGWKRVLDNVKNSVFDLASKSGNLEVFEGFDSTKWANLVSLTN